MNTARISCCAALALALLAGTPALAATENRVTSTPGMQMNSEWSLKEGNVDVAPQIIAKATTKIEKGEQVTLTLSGAEWAFYGTGEEGDGSQTLSGTQQQTQQTQGSGENHARLLPVVRIKSELLQIKGIGSFESLRGVLDALKPFSADQVETLAGIAEKLLNVAEKSGMTAETLRQLLTDLQTLQQNQWLGLLGKYKPGQALTAAVLEAMNQIKSMDLGVDLSTREALALADALLKALEGGWTPQWIARMKEMQDVPVKVIAVGPPVEVLQFTIKQLKDTDTYLATLAMNSGMEGAPEKLPVNLNIQTLGDGLNQNTMQATIRGGLASSTSMGAGTYGFAVNLSSGAVSNGFMQGSYGSSGATYNVSGGSGSVSGNTFNVAGFNGSIGSAGSMESVVSATLDGTAAKGFGNVGDIGATGSYTITGNGSASDNGTITGGQRVN